MFSLFNFFIHFFPGGSADPICPVCEDAHANWCHAEHTETIYDGGRKVRIFDEIHCTTSCCTDNERGMRSSADERLIVRAAYGCVRDSYYQYYYCRIIRG